MTHYQVHHIFLNFSVGLQNWTQAAFFPPWKHGMAYYYLQDTVLAVETSNWSSAFSVAWTPFLPHPASRSSWVFLAYISRTFPLKMWLFCIKFCHHYTYPVRLLPPISNYNKELMMFYLNREFKAILDKHTIVQNWKGSMVITVINAIQYVDNHSILYELSRLTVPDLPFNNNNNKKTVFKCISLKVLQLMK